MDAVAALLWALQVTIAVALLFVLPGWALGPLLVPVASTPLARWGRAAGVSLLTASAACSLLAWLDLLRPPIVVGVLLVMTGLPLLLQRRGRVRLPSRPRARRWRVGAGLGLALTVGLVVLATGVDLGGRRLPFTSTVWYYANLARAVAETGGFPATLVEWGAAHPFQLDYLTVTAHTGAALELLPGQLLVQLEVYRLAILLLGVLFATLLLRRWVSSWIALLGGCLLLATVRLDAKYLDYRPETWAFTVALFTLWLVDRALVERSRRIAATATLGAAVVFLAHAEVFLVFAAAAAGIAVARVLVAPDAGRGLGAPRLGLRFPDGHHVALAVPALAIVVGGIVLAGLASAVIGGRVPFVGYLTAQRSADTSAPAPLTEVPPGWVSSGDPTWDFYAAAVPNAGTRPPHAFFDPRLLPRSIADVWPGLDGRTHSGLAVLGALLVAPILGWPFVDARRRRAIAGWVVFAAVLFAGSYLLFAVSHTYVPERTGPRRLMPYELLVPVAAATFLLWVTDRVLRRGWRALLPHRGAMLAAGLALTLLTSGAVSAAPPQAGATADDDREPALSPLGYDAYIWIDANLPAGARILANAYTDGAIAGVARRPGILDGRAVYLEDAPFLARTTALLLGARVVFADPAGSGAGTYLARERVDYLLVATAGPDGTDLGGYFLFQTDLGALAQSARYTLAQSFGGGRLLLYAVRPST